MLYRYTLIHASAMKTHVLAARWSEGKERRRKKRADDIKYITLAESYKHLRTRDREEGGESGLLISFNETSERSVSECMDQRLYWRVYVNDFSVGYIYAFVYDCPSRLSQVFDAGFELSLRVDRYTLN